MGEIIIQNQFNLLIKNNFLPFFLTQFLGAFNDNVFKSAYVVLLAYGIIETQLFEPDLLVTAAAGVFIVPFILLTPLGGDLADRYDKAMLMRRIKIAEIIIVLLGILGLILQSAFLLMFVLFLLGVQSAVFNPSKFSILPQHLKKTELIGGNALLNTSTYIAILVGSIFGTIVVSFPDGLVWMGVSIFAISILGYLASSYIPDAKAPAPKTEIKWNTIGRAFEMIKLVRVEKKQLFTCMIGSGWFFFLGALYLTQLPNFTAQVLNVGTDVLTFFLIVFSVGIGVGGLLNEWLLKSKIDMRYVPWALMSIAFFSVDLFLSSLAHNAQGTKILTEFLHEFSGCHITADIFLIAVFAGLYIVPIKAYLQIHAPVQYRARILAANAMLDGIFVLFSSIIAIVMIAYGFKIYDLFLMVGILSAAVLLYIAKMSPHFNVRRKTHG